MFFLCRLRVLFLFFLSNSTILLGIKGLISTFFAIMSLMLVYNELVISMVVVFVFSINSVLNIPSIFVEPNFSMTYLSTKIP